VDVRVVAATKQNLWDLVQEGGFREDLFHRLNVVKIELPSLREREEDIPLLVDRFLAKYAKGKEYSIDPDVMNSLRAYAWPGNVRELEHAVERAIALAGGDGKLKKDHLLKPLTAEHGAAVGALGTLKDASMAAEIAHIKNVLAHTGGKKTDAAKILGITRKNLWEKMKDYKIEG
jgi:transcriptional regulator with PAS, ATPase and Fis domain